MSNLAIILDMDGLMVDSEPLSRRAWEQMLAAYGHSLDDATYRNVIGHRTDETAAIFIEAYDLPLTVDSLVRQKTAALAKIRANGVPVMPGLYELQACIAQHGLPWAVATSSSRAHALEILVQLGLVDSCRAVAGGDEVTYGKPAPDIYLLAAGRLGVPAAQCMAVEDSVPGCRSAISAGMMVAAVPNEDTKTGDFSSVDHIFTSLNEIVENFDGLLAELTNR